MFSFSSVTRNYIENRSGPLNLGRFERFIYMSDIQMWRN